MKIKDFESSFLRKDNFKIKTVLEIFVKYKKDILIGISLIIFLLIIFFIFNRNDEKDMLRPSIDDNFIEQNKKTINNSGQVLEYDFTEAMDHIGEYAKVKGEVLRIFTAKSGVTFLDFCEDWSSCSFSAVIFSSDLKKFTDISQYERKVVITGQIKSYNGKAEIILKNPDQIEY